MRDTSFTPFPTLLLLAGILTCLGIPEHLQSSSAAQAADGWESISLPYRPTYVTTTGSVFWVCGAGEMVAKSEDGGHTWQLKHHQTDGEVLLHAGFLATNLGYAAGTNGLILWTRDGGETWTSQKSGAETVRDISFADERNGLRQTRSGIEITHDGGKSWNSVSIQKSNADLQRFKLNHGLAVLDDNRAAILLKDGPYSGQVIIFTVGGGKTWNTTDIPHTGIRRLVAYNSEYWAFGHEVIERDRPGGGYGVALAVHSQDGLNWIHGVRSPKEYSDCNAQGCILHDGAIVEVYHEKPLFLALPADGSLTPNWATTRGVVCSIGATLKCADARPSEGIPPRPEINRPISQSFDARDSIPGCLACRLESFSAPKDRVTKTILNVKFVVHKDGTVGAVRVDRPPAGDIESAVVRELSAWLFEPPRQGQPTEETRRVQLGVLCFAFPGNEQGTCSFRVPPPVSSSGR